MGEMAIGLNQDLRRRLQGYSGGRPDIIKLIWGQPRRVLDVGCGAGMLGSQIRQRFPGCVVVGIEPDAGRAAMAKDHFDHVIDGDAEDPAVLELAAALGPFDLVICADVLEHMVSPLVALRSLVPMLSEGGRLVTSLPNVRHVSTFVDLYLFGNWPQRDRGIHDRTHLHFFARPNILALGRQAGLEPIIERRNLRLFEGHPWSMIPAKLLDFWPFRGLYTFQYVHVWRRND